MMKRTLLASAVAIAAAAGSFGSAAYAATVDTALSLVIDISGSISASEYNTQMDGYANAFRDANIQAGILDTGNGDVGRIAVNVVQFGTNAAERIAFRVLDSIASINTFANDLDALARGNLGSSTAIGRGIDAGNNSIAAWLINNSATRTVMDVSGDGTNNAGGDADTARDNALATSTDTINGLVIGGGGTLLTYYQNNVIGGPDAFAVQASGFDDFGRAVKVKLNAEITGIPVPAALPLLAAGIGVFGFIGRRRRKNAA